MPLSFKDLLDQDIEQVFLNVNEHAEYLILRTPCGRQRRIKGIATLTSQIIQIERDKYQLETLTVRVSQAVIATEPEEGTAIRRESDSSDRWFSFAGPGEGETTGLLVLEFVREVPLCFGGNRIQ